MTVCPVHQFEFRQVPAGISKKTGKPYSAFWACPEMGCTQKPVPDARAQVINDLEADQAYINSKTPLEETVLEKERIKSTPDWDAKDRQSMAQTAMKSASEIVAAMISSGVMATSDLDDIAIPTNVKQMANEFFKQLQVMKSDSSQTESD